ELEQRRPCAGRQVPVRQRPPVAASPPRSIRVQISQRTTERQYGLELHQALRRRAGRDDRDLQRRPVRDQELEVSGSGGRPQKLLDAGILPYERRQRGEVL